MLGTGGRKSRNKVIVGEPAIGSLNMKVVIYILFTPFDSPIVLENSSKRYPMKIITKNDFIIDL